MKLNKLSATIRIVVSMLILCSIENGTIVSRYNTVLIILCFIELVMGTCYLVIMLSVKE
uniref:Uncharacterized protein n=1 Tax=Podoviridae sp. ctZkC8 TaxID=2825259 RepID=A0A8S5UBP8_9CAUD|nr:MAG TPA: hypothetical protein [Podoviridae sp. ctZkC8]